MYFPKGKLTLKNSFHINPAPSALVPKSDIDFNVTAQLREKEHFRSTLCSPVKH